MATSRSGRIILASFVSFALCAGLYGQARAAPPEVVPRAVEEARADITWTFGFLPGFLKTFPGALLPAAWDQMKLLQMNPGTALALKVKELIGLAVASQIPCQYCIYAHAKFAAANGATADEISDAVAVASQARFWNRISSASRSVPRSRATTASSRTPSSRGSMAPAITRSPRRSRSPH